MNEHIAISKYTSYIWHPPQTVLGGKTKKVCKIWWWQKRKIYTSKRQRVLSSSPPLTGVGRGIVWTKCQVRKCEWQERGSFMYRMIEVSKLSTTTMRKDWYRLHSNQNSHQRNQVKIGSSIVMSRTPITVLKWQCNTMSNTTRKHSQICVCGRKGNTNVNT